MELTPLDIRHLPALDNAAIFFDIDGTLAAITSRPEDSRISPSLLAILGQIWHRVNGAMAILSGRPIHEIDALLFPKIYPLAAEHGACLRTPEGQVRAMSAAANIDNIAAEATASLASISGVLVEKKNHSVALHYRAARAHRAHITHEAIRLATMLPGWEIMHGKMVVEIKQKAMDKGRAMDALLRCPSFSNRQPVVFGDDISDEPAFQLSNTLGGTSIKIGAGSSCARFACHSQSELEPILSSWLSITPHT